MALTEDEFARLQQLLRLHYAFPLPYPLSGANFEILFATAVAGDRHEGKALFDVTRGRTGWSLKTIQKSFTQLLNVEVVIKRSDILRIQALSLDSPADVLGRAILADFNAAVEASKRKQRVDDARTAFLVRDGHGRHCFFDQTLRPYRDDEVVWRWTNETRKGLQGHVGGTPVLRWYRSGTQLFGVYAVPPTAPRFLMENQRRNLEDALRFFLQT